MRFLLDTLRWMIKRNSHDLFRRMVASNSILPYMRRLPRRLNSVSSIAVDMSCNSTLLGRSNLCRPTKIWSLFRGIYSRKSETRHKNDRNWRKIEILKEIVKIPEKCHKNSAMKYSGKQIREQILDNFENCWKIHENRPLPSFCCTKTAKMRKNPQITKHFIAIESISAAHFNGV